MMTPMFLIQVIRRMELLFAAMGKLRKGDKSGVHI